MVWGLYGYMVVMQCMYYLKNFPHYKQENLKPINTLACTNVTLVSECGIKIKHIMKTYMTPIMLPKKYNFVDVTLAGKDKHIFQAHKVML